MRKVFCLPSHATKERTSGVDFTRIIQPMKHLNGKRGYETFVYDPKVEELHNEPLEWLPVAQKYDLFYFNYIHNPWGFAAMGAMARGHNTKLVMDTDDAIWYIKQDNPAYQVYQKGGEALRNFTSICNEVDKITVTNNYLKNVVLDKTNKDPDDVIVIPNYIDLTLYNFKPPFKDDGRINLVHHGCFDDRTEILTENGFKLFKDLKKEKVATLNNEGVLEYQKPIKYQKYKYDADLIYAEGKQFSYAVTPNHQLYTKKRGKEYGITIAEDVYKKHHFIKKDALWVGKDEKFIKIAGKKLLVYEWLKFFGFWLAEGWTSKSTMRQKSGNITNCMQVGVVQRKENGYLEEMIRLLNSFGFNTYVNKRQVRVCNKVFWEYMKQFGEAKNKFIPQEIKSLSSRKLKILLDWYIKGDGHIGKNGRIRATTISKQLVDDLTEIALKVGWSANYYKKESKDVVIEERFIPKERCQPCYVVSFLRNTGKKNCLHSHVFPKHQSKKHYKGYVYDVEVPNHTLYVRRNGKCMWSGNSTTHFDDLVEPEFVKGVDRIMEEFPQVTLQFVGAFIPRFRERWGGRYINSFGHQDLYKWVGGRYREFMKEADIMITPLTNGIYNRCKSGIKFLENSAAGKAGVYQRLRQYEELIEEGKNGYLADTASEWYGALKKLIIDSKHRKSVGEAAYRTIQAHTIQDHVDKYADMFDALLDKDKN